MHCFLLFEEGEQGRDQLAFEQVHMVAVSGQLSYDFQAGQLYFLVVVTFL
jgi:hypothetical protein